MYLISYFVSIFVLFLSTKCEANDILGCGGFVKSHVSLDFSKIEIALYSKDGILKEKTECAPTNGYYFLPLYEMGQYLLKVHPPPGWSFAPTEVELSIDGVTDQCSTGQDINFTFNGFGITGRVVTAGQQEGPSGINVELHSEKGETRQTVTTKNGDFHFTPIIPGKYVVKANHAKWKLEPSQTTVVVKEGNTAMKVGSLSVRGYEVAGSVTVQDTDNPVPGVYVLLYSQQDNLKYRVEGCQTALLQGVPDAPLCHSITDDSGEFTFGLVPAGQYYLRTLHTSPGNRHTFQLRPDKVDFTVLHDSLYLPSAFEVTGVSIVGVVEAAAGKPLKGVQVMLDGAPVDVTDVNGRFTLTNMRPGTYTLSYKHEECEVGDSEVRVLDSCGVVVTAARARAWRVCGTVRTAHAPRTLTIRTHNDPDRERHVTHRRDGNWCVFLPSGVYDVSIAVSEQERRDGLQFYPLNQKVSVGHGPVSGITFSQLKATVSGTVTCLDDKLCDKLAVTLRSLSPEGTYVGQPIVTYAKNGRYSFTEVLPGSVEVSVSDDRLCWEEQRTNLVVSEAEVAGPNLRQRGFVLRVHTTHDTELDFETESERGTWQVRAGEWRQCVDRPRTYTLTPRGCRLWDPPTRTALAGSDTIAKFVATSHAVEVSVLAPSEVTDLVLTIEGDGKTSTIGPLVPAPNPDGGYVYRHTLYLAEGETVSVRPHSGSVLFSPGGSGGVRVSGRGDCLPAPPLRGRPALTLQGAIVPPVEEVTVLLTSDNVFEKQITGPDGKYSFGPLDASLRYIITAEKESYVFGQRDEQGNIPAHKLAEILLTLRDQHTDLPLQGALVSVSGGEYRRTLASVSAGVLRFPSLAPADYFVKPLMKEYRFSPPSTILTLAAGERKTLTLKGVRVAWSCVGRVRWVGGGGVRGAGVRVTTTNNQGGEATTDHHGHFRIRGLLPNVEYKLELKDTPELPGLRLLRKPPIIQITDNKDIEDLVLVAVQPHPLTDVNVLVRAAAQHHRSLVLRLAPSPSPSAGHAPSPPRPAHTAALPPPPAPPAPPTVLYTFPRVPADNTTYTVTLDSTLSRYTHTHEPVVVTFVSDGSCYNFVMEFDAKVKTTEQELGRSSLLLLPALIVVCLAYYYRHLLPPLPALPALPRPRPHPSGPAPAAGPATTPLDTDTIRRIVNAVNAVGKKPSKKQHWSVTYTRRDIPAGTYTQAHIHRHT